MCSTGNSWNPGNGPILWSADLPVKSRHAVLCRSFREIAPSCDLPIFPLKPKTRKCHVVKSWNHSMTACHEIVKLQHGPSAMKSSNYSMDLLPWNHQIAAWTIICHEILKSQDGPPRMKSSYHSMGQLPWNCQITAWTFYREIVKLQHGSSGVKSWNHRMDRLPWNREITAWPPAMKMSNCSMGLLPWNRQITAWIIWREIVKSQDGPSAMKSWNYRMDRLPWNCQIIAWANCREIVKLQWNRQIYREIVKLQHEPSAMKSGNHRMKLSNHSISQLPWKCKNLVWLDSVVWIWKLFSVMCFWFFAPTYYVFGLRMHFRWCAFGELRQNINRQNINCLEH